MYMNVFVCVSQALIRESILLQKSANMPAKDQIVTRFMVMDYIVVLLYLLYFTIQP